MTQDNNNPSARSPRRWRKIAVVFSLLIVGSAVGFASAQVAGGRSWGPGRGGDEAMMKKRADHVLLSLDATPQQRAEIETILTKASSDLGGVRSSFLSTRGEFADLLTAGQIDRDAAERLRAERIATADTASKRMLTAALDAANVLTPDQRAKLKARF